MRKIFLVTIVSFLFFSCSSSKQSADETRYFDQNNNEISKRKFKRIRSTNEFLDIPGDSRNHKKLVWREKRGKITNRRILESLLEEQTNRQIDSTKPLIIVYYPGKDACNSSSSATKQSRKIWFGELEEGIQQIAQTKPIYIYKNKEGLKKYFDVLTWHKDPERTIERLFFENHYPCSSFVAISKEGEYIAYFGEFPKEYVWEATQIMTE